MDWGSLADWVSGVATAAAVIFAFLGLRGERERDRQLNQRISDEQLARDYSDRSAQASKVSAWHEDAKDVSPSGLTCIRNGSESTIYDVYLALVNGQFESEGSSGTPSPFGRLLRVVPPQQTLKFPAPEGWEGMSLAPSYDITFRDSQGVTWFRSNWGHLLEREHDVFVYYDLPRPYPYYGLTPTVD
ncbi:hypothetical protein MN0502_02100 [Arthrobacter sp. MN05-02]|nr:hypothetical protein MN0502_02100 [Arthrobacter sp. MN05-02]